MDLTPVHDSVSAGGSAMTTKDHKLLKDNPGGKEQNKPTNPDNNNAAQAATQTTDTSEAATYLHLPNRPPPPPELKTDGGVMTSPFKRNTTKPTRSRLHRQ